MRISDWSSDVCSSDLLLFAANGAAFIGLAAEHHLGAIVVSPGRHRIAAGRMGDGQLQLVPAVAAPGITTLGIKAPGQGLAGGLTGPRRIMQRHFDTGRASCRVSVVQYV